MIGGVQSVVSKLPTSGVSIFEVMSGLARQHQAVNLSQGFPDFGCAPELIESVAHYMREGYNQYAQMPGVPALREALAMKIEHLYGRRYDPVAEIAITTGATEALFAALTALVRPGDEVVLFQPAYDSYLPAVQLSGGVPRFVTLRYPEYRIDWDEVRGVVSSKTRVVVLNTPHNPTGMMWSPDDMRQLAAVLAHTGAVVISDEVYEHVRFDGTRHESVARSPDLAARALVISSFGKTYHTTGWKVGYCAGPAPLVTEVLRVRQWMTFSVNGAVQMAYADAVREDPACDGVTRFYEGRKARFLELTAGSRFRPLPCRGTYFQLMDYSTITGERDADFALRLVADYGVAAIPISPFLQPGADAGPVLRFCFAKRDDTLERAAERLHKV
jgi:methionine aminotransferase